MIAFKNILCPTDLSDASVRALTYAAAFARWYGAQLTGLQAVPIFDPIVVAPGTFNGPAQMVVPRSREEIRDQLRGIANRAGMESLDVILSAKDGDPARNIVDHALETAADLVVMGTHGRSGFERLLIGSVAEKVVRKASCPVLLVPPHLTATVPEDVTFKHILCAMDFSPAALQALGFALDLARQADGVVTVLHVLQSGWRRKNHARMPTLMCRNIGVT